MDSIQQIDSPLSNSLMEIFQWRTAPQQAPFHPDPEHLWVSQPGKPRRRREASLTTLDATRGYLR